MDLPERVVGRIIEFLSDPSHKLLLLTLNKQWGTLAAKSIYRSPTLARKDSFEKLLTLLNNPAPFYDYPAFINEIEILPLAADNLYMGDLDAALKISQNLEIFRLENCFHISNILIQSLAHHCLNLLQVELQGCKPISDSFIPMLVKNCKEIECLDFSYTNITLASLIPIINNCKNLVSLDISDCSELESTDQLFDIQKYNDEKLPLRYLNLANTGTTDKVLKFVSHSCFELEYLILEACTNISDEYVSLLVLANPNLIRLDLSFCDRITDSSLNSIISMATSCSDYPLQVLCLSACDLITPNTILTLVKSCPMLKLLNLDGCQEILSSFIRPFATFKKGEFECTLERADLLKLSEYSITSSDIDYSGSKTSTEKSALKYEIANINMELIEQSKAGKTDITSPASTIRQEPSSPSKARVLTKRQSMRTLKSQEIIICTNPEPTVADHARLERQEKIREKRLSRPSFIEPPGLLANTPGTISEKSGDEADEKIEEEDQLAPLPKEKVVSAWGELPSDSPASWGAAPKPTNRVIPQKWNYQTPPTTPSSSSTKEPLTSPWGAQSYSAIAASANSPKPIVSVSKPLEALEKDDAPGSEESHVIEDDISSPNPEEGSLSPKAESSGEPPVIIASGRRSRRSNPEDNVEKVDETVEDSSRSGDVKPWGDIPSSWAAAKPPSNWSSSTTSRSRTPSPPPGFGERWSKPNSGIEPITPSHASSGWNVPSHNYYPPQQDHSWNNSQQYQQPPIHQPQHHSYHMQHLQSPYPQQQHHMQQQSQYSLNQHHNTHHQQSINPSPSFPSHQPDFNNSNKENHYIMERAESWRQNEDPFFVYSNSNRGRMLIRLRIETKNGGLQNLDIHELDDPHALSKEFCNFWQMNSVWAPLFRLISLKKANALRKL